MARILIFDAQQESAQRLAKPLSGAGHQVSISYEVAEAVKEVRTSLPRLIIVSFSLPSKEGLSVIENLKLSLESGFLSILVITEMETDYCRNQIMAQGAQGYLKKPITDEQLLLEVDRILTSVRKRIMIVDDETDFVESLADYLETYGYEVDTALNGKEALEKVYSHPPDLLVVDLNLPQLDGWRVSQELKTSSQYRRIPLIVLSGLVREEGGKDGIEYGDFFMSKPCQVEHLLKKIKELLKVA